MECKDSTNDGHVELSLLVTVQPAYPHWWGLLLHSVVTVQPAYPHWWGLLIHSVVTVQPAYPH